MYIPTMAFVTYILLLPLLAGLRGQFNPELLGLTATAAFAVVIFEVLGLKLMCYLLNISNESQLLDLVAYSGYKFVGIIVTLIASEVLRGLGKWVGWTVFLYCFFANALFLVRELWRSQSRAVLTEPFADIMKFQLRSLKYVLLPESSANPSSGNPGASYTVGRNQKTRRGYFLFIYSYVVQFVFMWALSRQ